MMSVRKFCEKSFTLSRQRGSSFTPCARYQWELLSHVSRSRGQKSSPKLQTRTTYNQRFAGFPTSRTSTRERGSRKGRAITGRGSLTRSQKEGRNPLFYDGENLRRLFHSSCNPVTLASLRRIGDAKLFRDVWLHLFPHCSRTSCSRTFSSPHLTPRKSKN